MAAASSLHAAATAATPCAGRVSTQAARSVRVATAARNLTAGRGRLVARPAVAAKADAPSSAPASKSDGHELLLFEALREALIEEMKLDPTVCVLGEDFGHYGGSYKVTKGLAEMFGDLRVLDTPIAENSFTGMGVGAAMKG